MKSTTYFKLFTVAFYVLLYSALCQGFVDLINDHIRDFNVNAKLERLSSFSVEGIGITRVVYSSEDKQARKYIKDVCTTEDLEVEQDYLGNIFCCLKGSDPDAGLILSGSHIDAIPNSGKYDGTYGVLGAIGAISALKKSGHKPARSTCALMFTSEEPTRFGLSCLGSRVMAGALQAEQLGQLVDAHNQTLGDCLVQADVAPRHVADDSAQVVASVQSHVAGVAAFVELHIEQGPVLEEEQVQIGVVTAIAAPAALWLRFTGPGGHAGGQLMGSRRDPGLAAAEMMLAVEKFAKGSGSQDTVATTGQLLLRPNAVNGVPQEAYLTVDVRDTALARRDDIVDTILETARMVADKRGVQVESGVISQDPPAVSDERIVEAIEKGAQEIGASQKRMVSRAYHDSLFMS